MLGLSFCASKFAKLGKRLPGIGATRCAPGGGYVRQQRVVTVVAELSRADGIELQIFVDNPIGE